MNPTKEPTETQRALASRMQHLFNSGHPSYVESGALRLIVEHDAALEQQASSYAEQTALAITQRDAATARAEAAELLVVELSGLLSPVVKTDFIARHTEGEMLEWMERINQAIAKTPASMVSKLAELEKDHRVLVNQVFQRDEELSSAMRKIHEQDAELARLREAIPVEFQAGASFMFTAVECMADKITALRARVSELEKQLEGAWQNRNHFCEHINIIGREVIGPRIDAFKCDSCAPDAVSRETRLLVERLEQRAERLADVLRAITASCTKEEGVAFTWYQIGAHLINNAKAALADQPAQAKYPHPKCDQSCYYHCTENGQHAPDCVTEKANTQLAALIAEVQRLRMSEEAAWKSREFWGKAHAEAIAQRDTLIAAGDVLRKAFVGHITYLPSKEELAAWDAAKQGAQPVDHFTDRAKAAQEHEHVYVHASELTALREDRANLNWAEENVGIIRAASWPIADTGDFDGHWEVVELHMAKPHERVIGTGSTIRAAIAAARKTEGAS